MGDYQHLGRLVVGVEDWSPPSPPRRKCQSCPTLISRYNAEDYCNVCLRKRSKAQRDGQ